MSTKVDKSDMFSGKADGITFEKLDEMMLSWGRSKFGDKYATQLWKDELTDISKLDLKDELDYFEYEMHCTLVYDVLCYDSAKYADGLFDTQRFWTVQYQLQTRQRFRERMYCYLETIVKGEAARQVKKLGVRKMAGMRDFLFRRFGAGQPEVLEERVRRYLLGMPDPKTGEAFPPRCDMEAKLDELEAEREYLLEMCPKDQRDTYEDGKITTLTRTILRLRPKEYDDAVKAAMNLHRIRLYGKGGDLSKITNLQDNTRVIYNTDWLPDYDELREELVRSYLLQKRRREEQGQAHKKNPGHPVLPVLQGFEQPGAHQKTCYACGEKGHFKGDEECKAGPNDIWSGAPDSFKSKMKNGGKGKSKKGKGIGKGRGGGSTTGNRQRNKKGPGETSKIPCRNFNSGNGYCKWGDNCRFSHEVNKQGGKRKGAPSLILSKKDKKAKKEIVTMVMNDLKSALGQKKKGKSSAKEDEQDDAELYDLVRGNQSAMVIQRLDEGKEDYVPSKRVIMMITSEDSDGSDYKPKKSPDKGGEQKETKGSDEESSSSSSSSEDEGRKETTSNKDEVTSSSSDPRQRPCQPTSQGSCRLSTYADRIAQSSCRFLAPAERIDAYSDLAERIDALYKDHEEENIAIAKQLKKQRKRERRKAKRDRQRTKKPSLVGELVAQAKEEEKRAKDRNANLEMEWGGRPISPATKEALIANLRKDISDLETRKNQRWKQLINNNKWDDQDSDEEGTSIQKAIEKKRTAIKKIQREIEGEERVMASRPTTNTRHRSPPEWGSDAGPLLPNPNFAPQQWQRFSWGNSTSIHGPEEEPTPWGRSRKRSPSSDGDPRSRSPDRQGVEDFPKSESEGEETTQSDNDETSGGKGHNLLVGYKGQEPGEILCHSVDREDAEYLVLIKVKKGEKVAYAKYLLEEDAEGFHGPFHLSANIQHLIDHNDKVREGTGARNFAKNITRFRTFKEETTSDQGKAKGGTKVGFKELMESERRKRKRRASEGDNNNTMKITPRFEVGQKVYYYEDEKGNEKWHGARVMDLIYPGQEDHPADSHQLKYKILPDREKGQTYKETTRVGNDLREGSWAKPCMVGTLKKKKDPLLPLDRVGIDTCSALSVSSEREDFLWLDESKEAKKSVILRGVGGEAAMIGGRGPMVVETLDSEGNRILMFDPSAVYLKEAVNQASFRIFGQQRMKRFGFNLQQQDDSNGGDVLNYNNGLAKIPLQTNGGILTLRTVKRKLTPEQLKSLEKEIDGVLEGDDQHGYCLQVELKTSLLLNEAYLTKEEADRLHHWRMGHRSQLKTSLNEDCPICVEAKKRVGTFKRNYEFVGHTKGPIQPYWRLYCDGYGGQGSMGDVSYQGGIGGFVFACPTGSIKTKLYASTDQFPSCLFQVLQEIETEGYVTREVYVDTHSVNLSKATEEVAAMFRVKIIPVSAGTPQEMAYAESAVRIVGQMGRSLMCGAPHLPSFCWGLADLYATIIHDFQHKKKIGCSPYEFRTGRKPDLDRFFIKVFGAPCQYSPMGGADHKRAPKTEWGWFVGVQNPMCLVLRPEDEKVLSVSKKKIVVHEEFYAKYNKDNNTNPLANFAIPTIDIETVKTQVENLQTIKQYKEAQGIPDHVLSVKCLSDHKKHPELNEPTPTTRPPIKMIQAHQHENQGEETKPHVPEHVVLEKDLLLDKIKEMREMIKGRYDKTGRVEAIVKALRRVEEEAENEAPRKGSLKKKRLMKMGSISSENIVSKKRREHNGTSVSGGEHKIEMEGPDVENNCSKNRVEKKTKKQISVNDRVKIKTSKFGIGYARGRPEFTFGRVLKLNGKLYDVLWEGDDEDSVMTAHVRHLIFQPNLQKVEESENEPRLYDKMTKETILPILSVGEALSQSSGDGAESWPKDFYEALLREDWRDWVQAVKNENDSWAMFEASTEIPYEQMERGASIIPLGELFSIKRSGKHKFRQYALGNLLKEGKDFGETFSSTVSGDGLRWFCSLACTCKKVIKGWDATTGYLQTQQRVKVYAYLPSHSGYSDLSFEALAPFRMELKRMEKEGGIKSVKDFARRVKKERRKRPKTVLQLNKSIYGIPDAGQSFSMFMQGLHLKHCSMVQSEMDPCIYYRIIEDEKGVVQSYLIAISWVDDCRYFGTDDLVMEYEKMVQKNCKCTLEGESKEFVSIQINHQIDKGYLELTQEEYWVKAVERYKEFLPKDGPKERMVPLSPADEKLLVEPSDEEMKSAEHLPYPNMLGVCQYPSAYTRLEMRFAMSVSVI